MGKMVQGIRGINSGYNINRDVKNSIGNGEAKELICMTHRHELRWEGLPEERGVPGGGGQRGRNWDNCNSIINKMYLKAVLI